MRAASSSADERPGLTRVGVRFLLTLVGVMVFWVVFLEPGYDRFIANVGVLALRGIESPPMTQSVRMEGVAAVASHTEAYADVPAQRLELRTHHNNAPLLIALILATPGLAHTRRERLLVVGILLLATTHVLHFMLEVQWHYALANVGPYRVTDLRYLHRGFWQSLDNRAQVMKLLVTHLRTFHVHVGRLLMPILLWMILCRDTLTRSLTWRR